MRSPVTNITTAVTVACRRYYSSTPDSLSVRLVRNVSRCDEGRVSADNLHRILGESGRAHSGRMEGEGLPMDQ